MIRMLKIIFLVILTFLSPPDLMAGPGAIPVAAIIAINGDCAMNLDVVAFILSVISAVAAVLAVPALQPYLQRAPKNIYEPITRYRGRTITIFSVLTVAVLAVYIFFFTRVLGTKRIRFNSTH